ncbi:unnamed protein product [Heligmosomoides polygyrus]|uniref:Anaphase-promoting complex subunit 13 n=1 Tax=Heligmosomoides polygyrus TaxID=6339 RepID=A0A3P8B5G9_HELPZ|nr:unnamed protein product [Heligmosomoides polygyrus]
MDSPPDLSPNAPPTGFEDTHSYFANLQAPPAPASTASTGQASTEGSVDSSGFEKVDHDVLEEYGQQFVNEMQQALFGKPHDEADVSGGFGGDQLDLDAGFLLVGRKSFRITDHDEIHVLERTAPEIDEAPPITGRRHHNADDDDDDDEAWLSLFGLSDLDYPRAKVSDRLDDIHKNSIVWSVSIDGDRYYKNELQIRVERPRLFPD